MKWEVNHRRAVFGSYLLVVCVLLLAPVSQDIPSPDIIGFDKLIHFVLFAGVALLGYWNQPSVLVVTVFAVAVAGGLELAQWPLPYRTAATWDFFAGAVGAVGGAVVAGWIGEVSARGNSALRART